MLSKGQTPGFSPFLQVLSLIEGYCSDVWMVFATLMSCNSCCQVVKSTALVSEPLHSSRQQSLLQLSARREGGLKSKGKSERSPFAENILPYPGSSVQKLNNAETKLSLCKCERLSWRLQENFSNPWEPRGPVGLALLTIKVQHCWKSSLAPSYSWKTYSEPCARRRGTGLTTQLLKRKVWVSEQVKTALSPSDYFQNVLRTESVRFEKIGFACLLCGLYCLLYRIMIYFYKELYDSLSAFMREAWLISWSTWELRYWQNYFLKAEA